MNRIKILAGLDIAEHRRPQDGRMSFLSNGRPIDARIATLPTSHGEAVTLRLLDRDHGLLDIAPTGVRARRPRTTATGLRATLGPHPGRGPHRIGQVDDHLFDPDEINDPHRNVITVEDPVEYDIPGIKQTQVHAKIDYTFAAGLRAILRADPDVIVVGEIRDSRDGPHGGQGRAHRPPRAVHAACQRRRHGHRPTVGDEPRAVPGRLVTHLRRGPAPRPPAVPPLPRRLHAGRGRAVGDHRR